MRSDEHVVETETWFIDIGNDRLLGTFEYECLHDVSFMPDFVR